MAAVCSENDYLRTLIPAVTLHGNMEIRSKDVTAAFSEYNIQCRNVGRSLYPSFWWIDQV